MFRHQRDAPALDMTGMRRNSRPPQRGGLQLGFVGPGVDRAVCHPERVEGSQEWSRRRARGARPRCLDSARHDRKGGRSRATSTRWPTVRIIVGPGVDRADCHPELVEGSQEWSRRQACGEGPRCLDSARHDRKGGRSRATSTRWPTARIIVGPGVDRADCHPELVEGSQEWSRRRARGVGPRCLDSARHDRKGGAQPAATSTRWPTARICRPGR